MGKSLHAGYKDGVLQPMESVPLEERQQLTVTIGDPTNVSQDLAGYFTPEEWAEAVHDDIGLEEVRRALSTISGSLSEAVIALRQER
jgi:predicted DNA-binding antitoxin AbrB/MazE fold protein